MATPTTLYKVFELFEYFGSEHSQVNKVIFGEPSDVDNDQTEKGVVLRYLPAPSNFVTRGTSYEITAEFLDQVLENDINIKEVLSSTHQIVLDLIAFLHYIGNGKTVNGQEYNFNLEEENIQIFPVWDKYESVYWGHQVTVRFRIPFDMDYCEVPGMGA